MLEGLLRQIRSSHTPTHHHFSDKVARGEPNDQANHHACKDRDDRLMDRPNPLDLEIVRGDQSADEENAEDAETPSGCFS